MALAVGETDGNNLESMKAMVEGWIDIEETDYYHDVLANEVEEWMDIDELCQLGVKKANANTSDNENDDQAEKEKEVEKFCDVDSVNEIAATLKALSVQVDNFGDKFGSVSNTLNDTLDKIRSIFRSMNNEKQRKKIQSSRQLQIESFLKKN